MTRIPNSKSHWRRWLAGFMMALMILTPVISFAEETTTQPEGESTEQESDITQPAGGQTQPLADVLYVYNPEPLNRLNLREAPSLEAASLARYYTGTAVEVLGASGDFTNVRINDLVGYMQTTYLSETRIPLELGVWATVSLDGPTERLHLRAQTTEGAISLGLFYTGTAVHILEDMGEHYRVRLIDLEGYMQKSFLQVDGTPGKQDLTVLTNGLLTEPTALYAFPSREAPSLGMHYAGETVQIIGNAGIWYYVETGGPEDGPLAHQRGFMPGQAMQVSNYDETVGELQYTYAVVRSEDEKVKQTLRSEPAWSSDMLGTFLNTAQVLVLDTLPEEGPMPLWVNVSIGGLEGYMLGEFLGRVHKEKLEPQPIDYTEPDPTEAPAISLSGDETPAPDATGMTDSGDEPKGIVIPMDDDGGDSLG